MVGGPFKPSFGLSGIVALDVPFLVGRAHPTEKILQQGTTKQPAEKVLLPTAGRGRRGGIVPQRLLKPDSWLSIYVRPEGRTLQRSDARYGEVGRTLQKNEFFRKLFSRAVIQNKTQSRSSMDHTQGSRKCRYPVPFWRIFSLGWAAANRKWHIESHYPTQAKGRLEWATQPLLSREAAGKLALLKGTASRPYMTSVKFSRL